MKDLRVPGSLFDQRLISRREIGFDVSEELLALGILPDRDEEIQCMGHLGTSF
jgi:hypothetical protein